MLAGGWVPGWEHLRESEFPCTSKEIQNCWHSIRSHNHSCNNMAKQWGLHSGRYFNVWAAGRPSSKVENSATVQAPLLGHFVAAVVVASDCMPVMLNLLACAWKFRRAASTQLPGSLLADPAGCLADWLAGSCCTLLCVRVGGRK